MDIRLYRTDDLPILKQLMVGVFDGVSIDQAIEREFGTVGEGDWKWHKARQLDVDVSRKEATIFVAEVDGQIVAFITTWQDQAAGIGHIPNLSVAKEFQGRGMGRKLIQHALDYFRQSRLTHAKIETVVQNDVGNHLYTSIGFREIARQIHFVADLSEAESSAKPTN
jgi:ribosomal protein S18 acetylase RimI-like enzyme